MFNKTFVIVIVIVIVKTLHYSAKIEECGHDPKALHKITDRLLKNNQQRLPANIEEQHLPAEFMSHFDNKI